MQTFGMRDVGRILKLTPARIRALVAHGFVRPARGPRRALRFSFQDLIVLRTARALELARVPPRRIHRSLAQLRSRLPEGLPLSGLTIRALGEQVTVQEGTRRWDADSGQYVLEMTVEPTAGGVAVRAREDGAAAGANGAPGPGASADGARGSRTSAGGAPGSGATAAEWFERALELEDSDPRAAEAAYRRALELDSADSAPAMNLGRLLHERRALAEAERVYREAAARCEPCAPLAFNLALVLEDRGQDARAIEAYHDALRCDPNFADAHFNLARLYERAGDERRAIRHLACYRRLQ